MLWLAVYILVFVFAFGLSALMCYVARGLGRRFNLLDRPSGRKAHARPVALTGGWGFVPTFLVLVAGGLVAAGWLSSRLPASMDAVAPYLRNIAGVRGQGLAVLAGLG